MCCLIDQGRPLFKKSLANDNGLPLNGVLSQMNQNVTPAILLPFSDIPRYYLRERKMTQMALGRRVGRNQWLTVAHLGYAEIISNEEEERLIGRRNISH